jgi:isoamylase
MNAYWERLDFELPRLDVDCVPWRRWIDTALESPNDIVERQERSLSLVEPIKLKHYRFVMLIAGISKLSKSSTEENQNGDKNDGAARRKSG